MSLYIGVMSGTSLDGADAVLAEAHGGRLRFRAAVHRAYPPTLRKRLLALNGPLRNEIDRSAQLANELADFYAVAISRLLSAQRIAARTVAAVGCHGQTVRHQPRRGYSVQLVNGARLAERAGIDVVCDFRARDIAAGGEGAPLVPAYHRAMFHDRTRGRAIVNVGGIANITWLPARGKVRGFDCGPGNCLLDAWIRAHRGLGYDARGAWAARGKVVPRLLTRLLAHPYLRRPPPKSTGREDFGLSWVRGRLDGRERPVDVQATLLEFTATAIARGIHAHCAATREVYVCGGGARNSTLLTRLSALLPGIRIDTTAALDVDPIHVEGLAFAWLARNALRRAPGNLPSVTGARGLRVLGAIYPR